MAQHGDHDRRMREVLAIGETLTRVLGREHQFIGLGQGVGERLLDEDPHAEGKQFESVGGMARRWSGHHDEIRARGQIVIGDGPSPHLIGREAGPFRPSRRDGDHVETHRASGEGMGARHHPGATECDPTLHRPASAATTGAKDSRSSAPTIT